MQKYTMHYTAVVATFVLVLMTHVHGEGQESRMTCSVTTSPDGSEAFVLHGAPTGIVDCIMVENDTPPKTARSVVSDNNLTHDVCNLERKSRIISYQISRSPTTMKCRYECRPSKLRCKRQPSDDDEFCDCIQTGPTPALVPLSPAETLKALVQSSGGLLPSTLCDGKPIDTVLGSEVNCQRLDKEYPKTTLTLFNEERKLCILKAHPEADSGKTRPVWETFEGPSGKACVFVCRASGYKRTGYGNCIDAPCPCETSLAPRLVPVEDRPHDFNADSPCRRNEDGSDSCGWCGKCEESGKCVLREPGIERANHCPCGFKCPSEEEISLRTRHFGVPIACVRNKVCDGNGTQKPDLCISDEESDLADHCGCAPGYTVAFDEGKEICRKQ